MVTVIATHEVKDFATWKEKFDGDAPFRAQIGLNNTGLFRALDNENMVTLIFESANEEAVKGMISDPNLKASMEAAGVISQPEFKILKAV